MMAMDQFYTHETHAYDLLREFQGTRMLFGISVPLLLGSAVRAL